MKRVLILLTIWGAAALNGMAQTKDCTCKKPAAKKHVAATTTKTTTANKVAHHTSRKKRKKVMSVAYINYMQDSTYLGYYPSNDKSIMALESMKGRYGDLQVTSTAFENKGVLPSKYTCEGAQVSPPLNFGNIPAGTKSLAIIMYDPNSAPKKTATYWLMWNIDSTGSIPENFINDNAAQNPVNRTYGYQSVCPAAGTHYYHFRVYALDAKLILGIRTSRARLQNAMAGHVLAKGELVAQYNRHYEQ